MMKLAKSILILLSISLLFIAAENTAWAGHGGGFSGGHAGMGSGGRGGFGGGKGGYRGGYGHGYGRGYGYYGGFYGGVYFDPWLFGYPWGYEAAYPDVVVMPGSTQTYIEQGTLPQQSGVPQAVRSSDWYYCQNPAGYYPYVKTCSNGWQRVPSTPPR